uniref:Uncharacterized protein n=1 Tax=Mola mola TaxID=94237 RepID=A0A3Q3VV63_MOLML
ESEIYTGPLSTNSKQQRTIALHSLTHLPPMFKQLRKRLEAVQLVMKIPDVMKEIINLWRPLFVPLGNYKENACSCISAKHTFCIMHCKHIYSCLEQNVLNHVQDFLQGLEDDVFLLILEMLFACARCITFPVEHMKPYADFKYVITLALRFGNAFGRV